MRHSRTLTIGWGGVTLLLGGALGGVYTLFTGDWSKGVTGGELWLTVGLVAVAVGLAIGCLISMRGRDQMLRRNGTAYIIKEDARPWDLDRAAADKFLAESGRQFARVLHVPGPVTMDNGWGWALQDAARWDAKLSELAVAFRALLRNDDPGTPKGVFLWAWWSVAMAFGLRVTAAERGLSLDVWQRPSFGRTDQEAPVPWASRPHSFGGTGTVTDRVHAQQFTWPARLAVSRDAGAVPVPGPGRDIAALLIRVGRKEWGAIPDALVTPDPEPGRIYELDIKDMAGVCGDGKTEVTLHELRYDHPIGQVPWQQFPELVTACADWIVRQAAALPGHTLLLGAQVPQEVGLGVGIRAGHAARASWPAHLWPLMADLRNDRVSFVVPRLNLGTAPLDRKA